MWQDDLTMIGWDRRKKSIWHGKYLSDWWFLNHYWHFMQKKIYGKVSDVWKMNGSHSIILLSGKEKKFNEYKP